MVRILEITVNVTEFDHFCTYLSEMYAVVEYLEVKPVKSELDRRVIDSFRELERHIDIDDAKQGRLLEVVK